MVSHSFVCEMILSICITTWKLLSGVHTDNIYLQSCFLKGAPIVASVHFRELDSALQRVLPGFLSRKPPTAIVLVIRSAWGYV